MKDNRLSTWIEQGNVTISQLFFHHYKALQLDESEAMLLMQIHAFRTAGKPFPTPYDFVGRMTANANMISEMLQTLMQRGLLQIVQQKDERGVLYEEFSLQPLWERLVDIERNEKEGASVQTRAEREGELYAMFEQEFGRLLSPIESEMVAMWIDQDEHSIEVIRAALREAVVAQKMNLRYIDRILMNWKKQNVKTIEDVERVASAYRQSHTSKTPQNGMHEAVSMTTQDNTDKVAFYNWLEERE